MDDNINKIMLLFLDSESQSHSLQYYLNKELQEAIDAELGEEEEMNICFMKWNVYTDGGRKKNHCWTTYKIITLTLNYIMILIVLSC